MAKTPELAAAAGGHSAWKQVRRMIKLFNCIEYYASRPVLYPFTVIIHILHFRVRILCARNVSTRTFRTHQGKAFRFLKLSTDRLDVNQANFGEDAPQEIKQPYESAAQTAHGASEQTINFTTELFNGMNFWRANNGLLAGNAKKHVLATHIVYFYNRCCWKCVIRHVGLTTSNLINQNAQRFH
jgi:hypothetical protein